LLSKYPSLARLLGVAKAATKKAVATKKRKAKASDTKPTAPAQAAGTPAQQ
jgi:hypothetical protein